jgi:hypothetical protein
MKQPATPDHFRYSLLAIGLFASAILSGCMGAAPPAPESAAPAASASPSAAPSSPSASSGFAPYLVGIDIPEELREIERTGRISDAEAWINAKVRDAATPESLVVSLAAERQRLALLRRDFSRTPEQVLERLRKDMPSVSAWDLDRWQAAGVIQWLPIDGAPRYFRREPANLYRFCPEAKKLRDAAAKAQPQSTETAESTAAASALPKKITVPDVLAAADASETPIVLPVRMHARHVITVHPDLVPEGKIIRCWMPYPQEYQQQGDIRLIATDPPEHHIAANGSGQRTIYFERPPRPPASQRYSQRNMNIPRPPMRHALTPLWCAHTARTTRLWPATRASKNRTSPSRPRCGALPRKSSAARPIRIAKPENLPLDG